MRKFQLFILVFLILSTSTSGLLWADLQGFGDDVKKEEKENSDSGDYGSGQDSGGGGSNPFVDFLFQITVWVWIAHNGTVYYNSAPYVPLEPQENNFINHDWESLDSAYYGNPDVRRAAHKHHWLELSSAGSLTDDLEPGTMVSLQGRFNQYFGPDINYRVISDGSSTLHITTAGLDMPLVQANLFSMSFYAQGAFFRGMLDRTGGAGGIVLRSWPFKPVSLFFRAGGYTFENITFGHIESRLNFHISNYTLFGGINYLASETAELTCYDAGVSLYF